MTHDNSAIVAAFCRKFDVPVPYPKKLGAYFTEDGVYHNIPMAPVSGRAAIEAILGGMAGSMLSAGWEVKQQVTTGDVVMNERVDHFKVGDKTIAIPVMGVFELRDGKIAAWRDYFDLAMWQKQMA